jgi:tripartite-type tricarboxylate transporter receptor subunit TctC
MQKNIMKSTLFAVFGAFCAAPVLAAWPERPVTIIVPFSAGGSTDNVARISAEWLTKVLKQPVNVENRAGASGAIAADYVAQAPADGYTLFMVSLAQMSIVPHMQKVRYDPFRSFTPISVASTSVFALGVSNNFPGKTLQELIAYVKARPGQVAYGSSGTGSAGHLTMELFAKRAGITMTHIPYKGVAPAIGDLIGGHVPMVFGSVSEILRPYKAGKLRVVGVSSDKRLSQMPEVPTVAEQGFPGYQITTWNGLVAPAATPREVINTVLGALTPACKDAAFVARFQAIDADAWCSTPAEFAEMLKADYIKWGDAVKAAGVTAN